MVYADKPLNAVACIYAGVYRGPGLGQQGVTEVGKERAGHSIRRIITVSGIKWGTHLHVRLESHLDALQVCTPQSHQWLLATALESCSILTIMPSIKMPQPHLIGLFESLIQCRALLPCRGPAQEGSRRLGRKSSLYYCDLPCWVPTSSMV